MEGVLLRVGLGRTAVDRVRRDVHRADIACVPVGGALQGILLGGAAGLGLAPATLRAEFGLAAPRGRRRVMTVLLTAGSCAGAALVLAIAGAVLVGGTIHAVAEAAAGSEAALTPLSHVLGETDFGPISRALIGMGEGAMFGFGVSLGLTRRPPESR